MLGENGVWPPLPSRPVCTCSSGAKRQNSISQVVLVEGIRIPKCRGMTSFLHRTLFQSFAPSTNFHGMLIHKQPHPEEHRVAMRLEGWATTTVYPTLRDGPAGLLRVRLGLYQHSMKGGPSRTTR